MTRLHTLTLRAAAVIAALSPTLALAQPAAQCAWNGNASIIRGQAFTLDVDVTNSGTANGYGPMVEVFLPATVTFTSATSLGAPVTAALNTTTTPFVNPLTQETVTAPAGSRYVALRLPVSHVPAGASRRVTLTLNTTSSAALDVGTTVHATCLFGLGATAVNDPSTDAPLRSDVVTNAADQTTFAVTPVGAVVTGRFELVATGGVVTDVVTGPRSPVEAVFDIDAMVGTNIIPATATIVLPDAFQLISATATGGANVSTVPLAPAMVPGGTVTVAFSQINGAAGIDRTIRVRGFISQNRLGGSATINPATLTPITLGPTLTMTGLATPPSGQASLRGHAVLVRETVDVANPTPGSTVTVTQVVQQSDFFETSSNGVVTTLPGGTSYVGGSSTPLTPAVAGNQLTFTVGAIALVGTGDTTPAQHTNTFQLRVENTYSGGAPVSGGDRLATVHSLTSQVVGGSSRTVTEAQSGTDATLVVPAPTFTAVALVGGSAATTVRSGDVVTYRLTSTLPAGNHAGETITFTAPVPVFDLSPLTSATFGGSIVRYGAGASSGLPTGVTIAASATTGVTTLTFPSITSATPVTVEVLVDLTVALGPIDDGFTIVTPAVASAAGSAQPIVRTDNPRFAVATPALRVTTHAFASSTTDATFTPAATVTLPSPLTSTNLSTVANSNVAQVHAQTTVDVRLIVENRGSGEARDARVKIALPAGLTGSFVSAVDGAGTAVTTSGDLFGAGLDLDPIAATSTSSGLNLRVVVARLTVGIGLAPRFGLVANGQIERFTSFGGGSTFVGSATTTAEPVTITTRAATADVTLPGSAAADVTIGESFSYVVSGVVPNGAGSATLPVTVSLPAQLAFVSASSLTASPSITCAGAACTLPGPLVTNGGRDVSFTFNTVSNSDVDTGTVEQIAFTITAVVNNVSASVNTASALNVAAVFAGTSVSTDAGARVRIVEPVMTLPNVSTDGGALPDGGAGVDSNDFVFVTVPVRVGAGATNVAPHDVSVNVALPIQLTAEPGSVVLDRTCPTPQSQQLVDSGVTITFQTLALGDAGACDLGFTARVGPNITYAQQLSPTASVTWTSRPGSVSVPVSLYSSTSTERTGNQNDPGGTANTYRVSQTAPVRMASVARGDFSLVSTSVPATPANLVGVGEDAVLRFRVPLIEGNHPSLTFAIRPGTMLGVRRVELDVNTPGFSGVVANPTAITPAGTAGATVTASFGAISVPGDNNPNNNAIDLLVTVRDLALAPTTTGLVEGEVLSSATSLGAPSNYALFLLAPRLQIAGSVDNPTPTADAGVQLTTTLTNLSVLSEGDAGIEQTSPACNVPLTIPSPTGLVAQNPATDQLDNDNNGQVDDAPEAAFLNGTAFAFTVSRCLNAGETATFRTLFRTTATIQGVPVGLDSLMGAYTTALSGGQSLNPLSDRFDNNNTGGPDESTDGTARVTITPNVPRLNFALTGRAAPDGGTTNVPVGSPLRWLGRLTNTTGNDLTNVQLTFPFGNQQTYRADSGVTPQGSLNVTTTALEAALGTVPACVLLPDGGPAGTCPSVDVVLETISGFNVPSLGAVQMQAVLVADGYPLVLSDNPLTAALVDATRVTMTNLADTDGDLVPNNADRVPGDASQCTDVDGDRCDDCAVARVQAPNNDGPDDDNDGMCNLGDPSPADVDTDDDGLIDGLELDPLADTDGDGLLNVFDPDSDNDGLFDGTESGVTTASAGTDVSKGLFIADANPATRTNPLIADTDRGGRIDGTEDLNRNGAIDANEGDPTVGSDDAAQTDTDGDGLSDADEMARGLPVNDADADDDGVLDGNEPNPTVNSDGDGIVSNILDPDSDNDGLFDGTELGITTASSGTVVSRGRFIADAEPGTRTAVLRADTDRGGVIDGHEDLNLNGRTDEGERNPADAPDDVLGTVDTDGDGLGDSLEALLGTNPNDRDSDDDGVIDGDEQHFSDDTDFDGFVNATDPDSDDDGVFDGTERGVVMPSVDTNEATKAFVPDADPSTKTSPIAADTDRGGKTDGFEDVNVNGRVDSGESNPGLGSDDATSPVVDTDSDGLPDLAETRLGSNLNDADTDDDGLTDGKESNAALDADRDGQLNVNDPDSDNDRLFDGTEAGLTTAPAGTDVSKGFFVADADPSTRTQVLKADSDRGGMPDGAEDLNRNGRVDTGETNPLVRADDAPLQDSDSDTIRDADEGFDDADNDGTPNYLDTDSDGDGLLDSVEAGDASASTAPFDTDRDLTPDFLDLDSDADTVLDAHEGVANATPRDTDQDGILDFRDLDSDGDSLLDALEAGDATLTTAPIDTDSDGTPDVRDLDADGDGVTDSIEAGRADVTAPAADTDRDGVPDFRDPDSDGDTKTDGIDNCRLVANADQLDTDGDGVGDACSTDLDGDGTPNDTDNCPAVANFDQKDTDSDGIGDACDPDANGDGFVDGVGVKGAGCGSTDALLMAPLALMALALRRRRRS